MLLWTPDQATFVSPARRCQRSVSSSRKRTPAEEIHQQPSQRRSQGAQPDIVGINARDTNIGKTVAWFSCDADTSVFVCGHHFRNIRSRHDVSGDAVSTKRRYLWS